MIFIQYTEKLFVKPAMLVELKKHTYNPMLKLFYLVISFYQMHHREKVESSICEWKL